MFRGDRVWLPAFCALVLSGCGGTNSQLKAPARPFEGATLKAGVVGEPMLLETVSSALRGEWSATRGASFVIEQVNPNLKDFQAFDVLIFPGDRLGDLIDVSALSTIPEKSVLSPSAEPAEGPDPEPVVADTLQFADVVPAFRDQVSRYGMDRIGLPYGGSALVLAYRRAAFDRPENRDAARREKLTLEPPKTWKQFDALARFFQGRDWDGDGANDHGIALALGPDAEGVGDAQFLARAASLGLRPDQYSFLFEFDSMKPRIDSPPFAEALRGLTALKECGPTGVGKFDAEAARAAFRKGNVAMLIDRAERAGRWGRSKAAVGTAPLPGSERIYDPAGTSWEEASPPNRPSYLPRGGGWVVGITRAIADPRRAAALDFAKYLASPEVSNQIRADQSFPMLPVRSSQLGLGLTDPRSAPGVESRLWAEAIGRTLAASRVVPGLRIPEADGYLGDLAKGRAAALDGVPAEQALKAVARAWNARTERLGRKRQIWHYCRGLNNVATDPEPPPR